MKRFFWFLMIVVAIALLSTVGYRLFRMHYVRFPTWVLDTRFEIVSVDQNFVVIIKPLSMTNNMFFPVQFYLAALQVIDSDDNLVTLMNVNNPIRLESRSVTDVPVRMAVPLSVVEQIDLESGIDMRVFMDGTIQGSVYRIPFTKTVSAFITLAPNEEIVNDVLVPFLDEINEWRME